MLKPKHVFLKCGTYTVYFFLTKVFLTKYTHFSTDFGTRILSLWLVAAWLPRVPYRDLVLSAAPLNKRRQFGRRLYSSNLAMHFRLACASAPVLPVH